MAPNPSDYIQQFIYSFDRSLQKSTALRLFMKCHGNIPVMVIGMVMLTTSYGFTITSSPSTYDLYYCTTWYLLLMSCSIYQVFWSHNDPRFNRLLNTLFESMKKIEEEAAESQHPKMRATSKRVGLLQKVMYSTHFAISVTVSLRRIPDAKLPLSLRGLPITHPWIIVLQIIQCIINPPALISASHFFQMVITFVLCINDSFRILAHRLKTAHSDEDICAVLVLHGQLLDSCGQLIDILEKWIFTITTSLFCVSLGVTMSMVRGAIDMENMLLLPGQMNSILILGLLGEKLQESTVIFADLAYSLRWYAGSARSRSLVLMCVTRGQKPLSLRCGTFGYLTLAVGLQFYNKWYKFLNFLLKL